MGVDTFLYLLNYDNYQNVLVPALDRLLVDHSAGSVLNMFEQAAQILAEASRRFEFPWSPLHRYSDSAEFDLAVKLIHGYVPERYFGDLAIMEPEFTVTEPAKVREYCLREKVFGVIVEGLAVPWNLGFPPVHEITWGSVHELYDLFSKFEDAMCADVVSRSTNIPYQISQDNELIDRDLVAELWAEIERISPPGSRLWQEEYFRNLYLIFHEAVEKPEYRILAAYA